VKTNGEGNPFEGKEYFKGKKNPSSFATYPLGPHMNILEIYPISEEEILKIIRLHNSTRNTTLKE